MSEREPALPSGARKKDRGVISASVGFLPKQLDLELKQTSQIRGVPSLEAKISLREASAEPTGYSSNTPQISPTTAIRR